MRRARTHLVVLVQVGSERCLRALGRELLDPELGQHALPLLDRHALTRVRVCVVALRHKADQITDRLRERPLVKAMARLLRIHALHE